METHVFFLFSANYSVKDHCLFPLAKIQILEKDFLQFFSLDYSPICLVKGKWTGLVFSIQFQQTIAGWNGKFLKRGLDSG